MKLPLRRFPLLSRFLSSFCDFWTHRPSPLPFFVYLPLSHAAAPVWNRTPTAARNTATPSGTPPFCSTTLQTHFRRRLTFSLCRTFPFALSLLLDLNIRRSLISFFIRPFISSPFGSSLPLCSLCRQQFIQRNNRNDIDLFSSTNVSSHSNTSCLAYQLSRNQDPRRASYQTQTTTQLTTHNCNTNHQVTLSLSNNSPNPCTASTNSTHFPSKCTAKIPATSRSRLMRHNPRVPDRLVDVLTQHTPSTPAAEPVLPPAALLNPAR